jgi:predicted nuclease of predicted toxin-antitoxin system
VRKRVLLDESVPRHLAHLLTKAGYDATPYPNEWKQITNGELLRLAEEAGFAILVTNDRSIYAQQNLRGRKLSIIVLPTNLRREIVGRAADVVDTIRRIDAGQHVTMEPSGGRGVIDYAAVQVRTFELPPIAPFKTR